MKPESVGEGSMRIFGTEGLQGRSVFVCLVFVSGGEDRKINQVGRSAQARIAAVAMARPWL